MISASFLLSGMVFIIILFAIAKTETGQTSARPPQSLNRLNTLEVYRLHQRHVSDLNRTDPAGIFGTTSTLGVDLAHKTASADVIDLDTPATITKVSFTINIASNRDKESPTHIIFSGIVAVVTVIGLVIVIGSYVP